MFGEHGFVIAGEEEFAAEFSGAGAEIDDVVSGANGVGVVLDDKDGVAEIPQGFEDIDKALRVTRVEADGRLVENIERANKMRAERSGELNALRFAAGECRSKAVEREVIEADFIEKLQAGADFFEDFFCDFCL